MRKTKLLAVILCLVLVLSLFTGCQSSGMDATQGTTPSTEPSQSTEATVPSDDVTEPSSEVTEPSSEATEPTETTYPRTIEAFKSYLTPYMTYGEAKALWGRTEGNNSNTLDIMRAIWYLEEDGYYALVTFYPTANMTYNQYTATNPIKETNPDGTLTDESFDLFRWFDHMEAYRAVLYKGDIDRVAEWSEVLFDFPDPWMTEE